MEDSKVIKSYLYSEVNGSDTPYNVSIYTKNGDKDKYIYDGVKAFRYKSEALEYIEQLKKEGLRSYINEVITIKVANAWYIYGNELRNDNRKICCFNYKGTDFAVFKSDMDNPYQELLIKDENDTYWCMNIASIHLDHFIIASATDNVNMKFKENCDQMKDVYSSINLRTFFERCISNERYFNLCQLKYISLYYPDLYDKAFMCRVNVIDKNMEEMRKRIEERENYYKNKVNETNEEFKRKVEDIKRKILEQGEVKSENLEFFKTNNFHDGMTIQNCFLYLAKQYDVKIPLATQGFINQKLVSYNFKNNRYKFQKNKFNSKGSQVVFKCMRMLREKVKEDYSQIKSNRNIEDELER